MSDEVLAAIARALQLDETERTHLFDLARAASTPRPARQAPVRVPVALQQLLDAIVHAPAVIQTGSLDIVAANDLGRALYRRVFETQEQPNLARYVFLDENAVRFFGDWDAIADDAAAMLRVEVARAPGGPAQRLVDELTEASDAFARRWRVHDVADHRRGVKLVHDPDVGPLHLRYEALEVTGMPGTRLFGYTPDPDHPATRDGLRLLSSLHAAPRTSQDHVQQPDHTRGKAAR
ncbi:transcriptional regulator [Kocuria rhizophila]|uniref:MmyB family transcriptional regulator n=1 Tax=Kocuria rhizophila TaxID=72000 RepID=UPI001EF58C38|nr:transcriptional regulator [Kocuria rhizophila]MCG7424053.1 transcriptional regulator [Kocuria rhizophila]